MVNVKPKLPQRSGCALFTVYAKYPRHRRDGIGTTTARLKSKLIVPTWSHCLLYA